MDFTGESTQHNSKTNNTLFNSKFAQVVWQGWILSFWSRIQERKFQQSTQNQISQELTCRKVAVNETIPHDMETVCLARTSL